MQADSGSHWQSGIRSSLCFFLHFGENSTAEFTAVGTTPVLIYKLSKITPSSWDFHYVLFLIFRQMCRSRSKVALLCTKEGMRSACFWEKKGIFKDMLNVLENCLVSFHSDILLDFCNLQFCVASFSSVLY